MGEGEGVMSINRGWIGLAHEPLGAISAPRTRTNGKRSGNFFHETFSHFAQRNSNPGVP
jgi:hypothetical protein